ncbi:S-adenosyl-L-methionine-dependent methyltransferase [Phialemonium atrogriseum]|uniref:S-adenosyl-L-methionine-dependent methyltransferase n=1 Tax=Phialemonium atrogriseum TaxID=1093897 RepID=A0AAJ0FK70_9PEZI|nr:S-adenosyl-L-methionine-dependent methyltransferase [Phialemonium atrogriseum]KAK1765239.1 S-adenosyl-L-methionine-dependent methyltransferase [Phialemonium atrogriseum]
MTLSQQDQAKKDYDNSASIYNDYSLLPSGQLESQLIKLALGDCTGLSILDLGGGTGLHAREAIDLGASRVDVVDVSGEMLKIGQEIERSLGRESDTTMRFFQADVSKSLSHLPLQEGGYDVVMGNWIFSFADKIEVLEAMFRNIDTYLKPGGRFVGVRDADPWSPALESGKYGGSCRWVERIPGGVKYLCVLHCSPPIEFEGACLEVIYSGSSEVYERFGLVDVKTVSYEEAEIVQKDPQFWNLFLERPNLAVVQAAKRK